MGSTLKGKKSKFFLHELVSIEKQCNTENDIDEMGSTLKGKNLLLEEQILPFKSWSPLKRDATLKMT